MSSAEAAKAADYDVAIVGAGPSGATAADDLARRGYRVLLIDGSTRIKPCGGAIPPRLVRDFAIPDQLLKARIKSARIIAPSGRHVDMPISGGYVGMVDRDEFDEWLRERAVANGATRVRASFREFTRDTDGVARLRLVRLDDQAAKEVRARVIIGADGAASPLARQAMPDSAPPPLVYAYHEILQSPPSDGASYDSERCDVYYQGGLSPDFYGWVFPHGEKLSVGTGTARKGFSIRAGTTALRAVAGLDTVATVRTEGAPIPMRPRKRWDNGRDVVLAGDAAGVVAPASGEGIYYAMIGGQHAALAAHECLASGNARALAGARKRFMREHGRVFWVLGIMQRFWYSSDARRERFVSMCADPDVQRLTWEAYMNKRLVRARPMAHVRIFFKDLAHLLGLGPARSPDRSS
ncbi:MAG: geranylgeranyl diphosphate reductase [Gammaproteobacteria bacterium]